MPIDFVQPNAPIDMFNELLVNPPNGPQEVQDIPEVFLDGNSNIDESFAGVPESRD